MKRLSLTLGAALALVLAFFTAGSAQLAPLVTGGQYNMWSFIPSAKMYDAVRLDGHWCSQTNYYSNTPGTDSFDAIFGGEATTTAANDPDSGYAPSLTTYPTAEPSLAGNPQPDLPGIGMKGHFDGGFLRSCENQTAYDKMWANPAGSGSGPNNGSAYSLYGMKQGSIIGGCQPLSAISGELASVRGPSYAWLIGGTELDGYQNNMIPSSNVKVGDTTFNARLAINSFYVGETYEIINSEAPYAGGSNWTFGNSGIAANGDEYWTVPAAGCVTNNDYVTGPSGGFKQAHKAAFSQIVGYNGGTTLGSVTGANGTSGTGIPAGVKQVTMTMGTPDGGNITASPSSYAIGDVVTLGCGGSFGSNRWPTDSLKITAVSTSGSDVFLTFDKQTTVPYVQSPTGGQSASTDVGWTQGSSTSCIIPPGTMDPYDNPKGAWALDQMRNVGQHMTTAHNGASGPPYTSSQNPNLIVGPSDVSNANSYNYYNQFLPFAPPYADATYMDSDCGFTTSDCYYGDGEIGSGALPVCGGTSHNENAPQGRLCNLGTYGGQAEVQSNTGICGTSADGGPYLGVSQQNKSAPLGFPAEASMSYCLRGIIGMEQWADSQNIPFWIVLDELDQGDGGCSGGFFTDGIMQNKCSSYTTADAYTGPLTPTQIYYELRAFQQYNNDPGCRWDLNTTTCRWNPDGFYASFTGLPVATSDNYGANIYFTENSTGRVTMWYWRGMYLTDTLDNKCGFTGDGCGGSNGSSEIPSTTYVANKTHNGSGHVRGDSAHDNRSCGSDVNECMIDGITPTAVTMSIQNFQQIQLNADGTPNINNTHIDTNIADPTIMQYNPTGPVTGTGGNGASRQTPAMTECPQYPFGSLNINGCFLPLTKVTPATAGSKTAPMTLSLQFREYPQALIFQLPPPRIGTGYNVTPAGGTATPNPRPTPTAVPTAAPTAAPLVTAYDSAVLADAPSVFYPMADQSGTAMSDASGNNRPGAYVASPTLAQPGPFMGSYAASFGGTAYATTPIALPARPWSIEVWANPSGLYGGSPLVGQQYPKTAHIGSALIADTSQMGAIFGNGTGSTTYDQPTPQLAVGTWVYAVLTVDANGFFNLYENGTDVNSGTQSPFSDDTTTLATIAAFTSGSANKFDGQMSNVAIYPTVLSQTRVSAHYSAATTVASSGAYSSLAGVLPPGGSNAYYPGSPMHVALPATPALIASATNTRWNSDQSPDNWGSIVVSEDASNTNDGSDPTYYTDGDGTAVPFICALDSAGSNGKYYCDNALTSFHNSIIDFWNEAGSCPDSNFGGTNYGCPVAVSLTAPAGMTTDNNTDHHANVIKTTETYNGTKGYEVDGWGDGSLSSHTPPSSGNWTWAALGACSLAGDGTACSDAYATNMAGSLGLIKAEDILYCLTGAGSSNANCVLPTALAVAPKCNGSLSTYPASASDGQCGGGGTTGSTSPDSARVPEGERGYINETDAQVNAESIPDYAKVIRRTMDSQHFGFFDRDSNYSGGPGIVLQYQGAEAYSSMGSTDPWKTLFNYETTEGNTSYLTSGNSGKDMTFAMGQSASNVEWCANSHTDGLCD